MSDTAPLAAATYELWLYSAQGARLMPITGWRELRYALRENDVGELELLLEPGSVPAALLAVDARIAVYRAIAGGPAALEGETVWLIVRTGTRTLGDGAQALHVLAHSANGLLERRIVAYAAGTPQTAKAAQPDSMMVEIVRENFGDLAASERNLGAQLSVVPAAGAGPLVFRTFPRRRVLRVLQEIADAGDIFFDVVAPTPEQLQFRTYSGSRGADRRWRQAAIPVVLSPEYGSLANVERAVDHRGEHNVIYVAGQGLEEQRVVATATDVARAGVSPFARREQFVDARHISQPDGLATEADAALRRGRPQQLFAATARDTVTARYGQHWRFGDLLSAEADGTSIDCRVVQVQVVVERDARTGVQREQITASLRASGGDDVDALHAITGAVEQGGAVELPVFTVTPTANAAPIADGAGQLADGWLPATIARAAIFSLAPAANQVPLADGTGVIAEGWLPATIARAGIFSLVAAANKVPLADGSGVIAEGWLPATIARAGIFSLVAAANKAPIADGAGVIADGWLPGTIARTAVFAIAPAANKVPQADALGVISSAWLPATIARTAVFATAPAANKVPQADGAGLLADGWLPAAVARTGTAQSWSAVQTFLDRVGIGQAPVAYATATVGNPAINLGAGGSSFGLEFRHNDTSSASNAHYVVGANMSVQSMLGAGIANSGYLRGLNASVYHRGAGAVTSMYGAFFEVGTYNGGLDSTGSVGTLYGLYVGHLRTPSSTITTGYGIYVANVQGSVKYGLYLADSDAAKPVGSTWIVISDERTKRNIRPYRAGLAALRALPEPIEYELNGRAGTPAGVSGIGFSAQAMERVQPRWVRRQRGQLAGTYERQPVREGEPPVDVWRGRGAETDILSLDLSSLPLLTMNATLELDRKVALLEQRVQALEQRLAKAGPGGASA